jgi:glyoxylase-like metal-dependent hydrolase (beta-lactamase superfamily II)
LIYTDSGEAIIASTPPSDQATMNLIHWVKSELNAEIVGYIIDRWHPDAMEGLDIVQKLKIKSYANERTRIIAGDKGLPVPDFGFKTKMELKVGNGSIVCHYLGEAHTSDGIVVWLPAEKVLFGGNEIREFNGWVGNIGDANLDEWSNTIARIRKEYDEAEVVIPGHGKHGSMELIDYTLDLYKPGKWGAILLSHNTVREKVFDAHGDIFEVADNVSIDGEMRVLENATVFVLDRHRYLKIDSPLISHNVEQKLVQSEYGRLQIYLKNKSSYIIDTDLYFERLFVQLRDDEIPITIILKEMIR